MNDVHRWTRGITITSSSALLLAGALAVTSSCLNRPVTPSDPQTSNRFVDQVRHSAIDKIDLLFVIDNSVSMADKQRLLKRAVPDLLRRTLDPPCVDAAGAEQAAQNGSCPAGTERAIPAIEDVHIGVISSSLGTSGGSGCSTKTGDSDHARLLPTVRGGAPSWNGSGFLVWDPRAKSSPPGHSDLQALIDDFSVTIDSVRDEGCGYEAPLEAWYRFLVDPEPPLEVVREGNVSVARGVDEELLRQRAAFMRPDSLLVVVMLSDEDDCSISDQGPAWLMTSPTVARPRPTSACASDPTSPCCRPCTVLEQAAPDGCLSIADDPACSSKEYPVGDSAEDHRNLRCFDQKRRFGIEFLHPTSRYVAGLSALTIPNRNGELVPNPVFHSADGVQRRDQGLVFLAGIVGVPWQDVATEQSLTQPGLEYLGHDELEELGRWSLIAGERPLDPLMVPSSAPRSGSHPLLGVPLAPPTSLDPRENPINGHEFVDLDGSDLQYACIFPMEQAQPCPADGVCDCQAADLERNRPLCQPPEGGPAETNQYFAKAYPGLRHLEVLRGLGESGLVASICPKVSSGDSSDPSYGYNPALGYLAGKIASRLERCLPRPLDVEPDGSLPCRVAEAVVGECDCTQPGRRSPSQELAAAVKAELELAGHCGPKTTTSCSDYCVCELAQSSGTARDACQNEVSPGAIEPGYCYVDAERGVGDPVLVDNCPLGKRHKLRFVGEDIPRNGAVTFMACSGADLGRVE